MTRRELEHDNAELRMRYDQLRRITVALMRERGGTARVSKADYDDAAGAWVIATEPIEYGEAVEVKAVNTEAPQLLTPTLLVLQ